MSEPVFRLCGSISEDRSIPMETIFLIILSYRKRRRITIEFYPQKLQNIEKYAGRICILAVYEEICPQRKRRIIKLISTSVHNSNKYPLYFQIDLCKNHNERGLFSLTVYLLFILFLLIISQFVGIITLYCKRVHPSFVLKTPKMC